MTTCGVKGCMAHGVAVTRDNLVCTVHWIERATWAVNRTAKYLALRESERFILPPQAVAARHSEFLAEWDAINLR